MSAQIFAPLLAFALAAVLVRILAGGRLAGLVLDMPNERSLHERPIPRTGGVGLMLAVALVVGSIGGLPLPIVLPALLLAALFLVDDVRGLPVILRFVAQLAAALAFLAATGPYPAPWLVVPVLAVGIVWSCNLYNFMDGSNGMAGGMALIGFAAFAIGATFAGETGLGLLASIVAAAAAGFLVWNFGIARIFLGDAGSIPLGFLAAAIGIAGWQRGAWPSWWPLLVFSTFAVDATLTLGRRIWQGEKPWQAHRTHYYQRLIRAGWSHRRLALAAYALMLATSASALTCRTASFPAALMLLALWAALYVGIALAIDRHWTSHTAALTGGPADTGQRQDPSTGRNRPQYVARPPEMSRTVPVVNEQSSDAANATRAAISSTLTKRPRGIFDSMKSMCCCVIWSKIAVLAAAGVMALTEMSYCASSLARLFVSAMTPALDAE